MTETIEIKSTQNDLVKFAVKLQDTKYRKAEKLIFVDGEKTVTGLINDGVEFECLFLKNDCDIYKNVNAKKIVFASEEVFKKITSTKSPCFFAGIIKEPDVNEEIFTKLSKIVLLENIKDAGNLGTIIRSAAAFSMEGIILFGDCVDLYNTKVIRASAQNIFKLPIIKTSDIEFIKKLKKSHKIYSTVVNSKNNFMKHNFEDKYILAFGSEAFGLSDDIISLSDEKLTFFMDNNVESLNLGVCASVAFSYIKSNS